MRPPIVDIVYSLVLGLDERLKRDGIGIVGLVLMIFALIAWATFTGALGWYVLEARVMLPMFALVLIVGLNAERCKRKNKGGK